MSRAPWVQAKPTQAFAKPGDTFDTSIGWRLVNPNFTSGALSRGGKMTLSRSETAEEVAAVYGFSREDSDAFSVQSHERALAAIAAGRLRSEIVPVIVEGRKGETVADTVEMSGTERSAEPGNIPKRTASIGRNYLLPHGY